MCRKNYSQAFGSGFIISPDGYLISNYHVVKDAENIVITFEDQTKLYSAKIIGVDPDTDIALLKMEQDGPFPFLKMGNSDTAQIGDIVIAIGNPFNLSHTFTTGVISAKGRSGIANNKYENFLQTDVAINPGNSGGPLINLSGEVLGINSVIISRGGGNIGLGFSIPINMVKSIIDQLKETGKVIRGWMGIQYNEISVDVATALNVENKGVLIQRVIDGSPAELAGLQAGDILLSFGKKEIIKSADLLNEIAKSPVGKRIPISYLRDGSKKRTTIKLSKQEETSFAGDSPKKIEKSSVEDSLGLRVTDMGKDILEKYRVRSPFGVIITSISPNSPLYSNGVRQGDIIEEINRTKVKSYQEYLKITKGIDKGDKVLFKIRRDSSIFYFVIRS